MKKNFDFYWTQRIIDLLMKVAGVVVTSAATWQVASEAFDDIQEPWLTFVRVGALLLVEGAFIISWMAIDTQHSAPMAMKVAWSITLIVIYAALLVIAFEHGEGAAGWAFRFVLLVMILRSIYEAGVYETLRSQKKAERDIRSSFAVRRVARQLAKKDAIRALNMESNQSNYARELGTEVSRAKIEAEHEAALIDVKLMRERLLSNVHARDNLARKKFQAQLAYESKKTQAQLESAEPLSEEIKTQPPGLLTNGDGANNSSDPGMLSPNMNDANSKKERMKDMLLWALMENPNHSKQALSAHLGASPGTVRKYLKELNKDGKLKTSNKTRSGFELIRTEGTMA